MAAAAKLLGAELLWGRAPDGTLADDRPARLLLVELYRRFRPSLVLAHSSEDYHPDHRAAATLAEAASWFCTARGHRTKSAVMDAPPALWCMDTLGMSRFEPGFYVDVSEYMPLKEAMLACHRSQAARGADGDFTPLVESLRRQAGTRGAPGGRGGGRGVPRPARIQAGAGLVSPRPDTYGKRSIMNPAKPATFVPADAAAFRYVEKSTPRQFAPGTADLRRL